MSRDLLFSWIEKYCLLELRFSIDRELQLERNKFRLLHPKCAYITKCNFYFENHIVGTTESMRKMSFYSKKKRKGEKKMKSHSIYLSPKNSQQQFPYLDDIYNKFTRLVLLTIVGDVLSTRLH